MPISTILMMILGGGVTNMIVSAVTNHVQGDDVGRCARSGLAGGIAGGVIGCLFLYLGINVTGNN